MMPSALSGCSFGLGVLNTVKYGDMKNGIILKS